MKFKWSRGLLWAVLWVFFSSAHAGSAPADTAKEENDRLRPLVTTSELIVGQNRFAFGLLKGGKLLEGADVTLRLYSLQNQKAQVAAVLKPTYQPLGLIQHGERVHQHADGRQHVHSADEGAVQGVYLTQVEFPRAATWGIELQVRQAKGSHDAVHFTVVVRDAPATPALGSPAPRSRNLIGSDVTDLSRIDTSPKPDIRLHQVRIADAIAQRRPQLIVFATPQFCTSRMCGPVVDIVRTLLPTYGKRVAFTHQEIWQDFALKQVFPTIEEWSLRSEPWIFVVDGNGIIRAKFEGIVTVRELESALQNILDAPRDK